MRKFLLLLTAAFFLAIYCICSSETMIKKISVFKYGSTSLFASDKYRYGDLYGMSYVPAFRKLINKTFPTQPDTTAKIINLYALCDSYIWGFVQGKQNFIGVNSYESARTNVMERLSVSLDTAKHNVLLLEFTERNIGYLNDTAYMYHFIENNANGTHTGRAEHFTGADVAQSTSKQITNTLFNPNINTNIEFLIWDSRLLTPIKEIKGYLNSLISDKINTDVLMSRDGKHLFFWQTVEPHDAASSFTDIPEGRIDTLVQNINGVVSHYKAMGFEHVYLSMIPNPVSILQPNYQGIKYNQLIYRIQSNAALNAEYIDAYSVFSNAKESVYFPSDTHWNLSGFGTWLHLFNKKLETIVAGK